MTENAKTLVADEDPAELATAARVLRPAGFDVMESRSRADCLRTAR
jgi:hypothetical protein